uniref:AP180 N-terminal homology (ANTH) domain-containing protein n=1 Tax=Parascaris equorum TaxID=6256 RepID=A0A914S6Y7_PAREQ
MFFHRGNFQIIAVHKALNKNEVPLKQKHVRVLIVGTHKEKSSSNATIPGSLQLTDTQLNTMVNADVNQSFELSIEMLDQMDDLLNLQTTEFVITGRLQAKARCVLVWAIRTFPIRLASIAFVS